MVIAWWKEPHPSLDDFFVRPGCGDFWVEAHENVHVVVHDGKPADGDGEEIRKFLQAKFDPFFAVARFLAAVERDFAQQECAADTAGDAVIPARNRYIDKMGASHRHGVSPRVISGIHLTRQLVSILQCVSFCSCSAPCSFAQDSQTQISARAPAKLASRRLRGWNLSLAIGQPCPAVLSCFIVIRGTSYHSTP